MVRAHGYLGTQALPRAAGLERNLLRPRHANQPRALRVTRLPRRVRIYHAETQIGLDYFYKQVRVWYCEFSRQSRAVSIIGVAGDA
jgi:hypothetical protein